MKRNVKKHPDNIIWLDENCIDKESITATYIIDLCKEKKIPLSSKFEELLTLLQVPHVARSMFTKLMECERIFKKAPTGRFIVGRRPFFSWETHEVWHVKRR